MSQAKFTNNLSTNKQIRPTSKSINSNNIKGTTPRTLYKQKSNGMKLNSASVNVDTETDHDVVKVDLEDGRDYPIYIGAGFDEKEGTLVYLTLYYNI